MKLVIPYRTDPLNGLELRYCIRSMVKYFSDLEDVLLIGDRPEWYTGPHIQADQLPIKGRREFQIVSKLLLADGIVLYSSDDVYALKHFDSTIPDYYHRTCNEMKMKAGDKRYREMYKRCPKGWLDFDIHQPMVIDVEKYRTIDFTEDRPIKTVYANTFPKKREHSVDGKVRKKMSKKELKAFISVRKFFSSDPSYINDTFINLLAELYPDKSKYES